MRTFSARAAPLVPKIFLKKIPAAICFEFRISSLEAAEK